ncbi:MAG TPA: conserved phage C-terminal domain-containing protein [Terriglobales bacterium]|nr:conserved phage C-terminal domain-containing protein [Terriglobales bacterium]
MYSRIFDDPDYQRLSPRAKLTLLTARQCEQAGPGAIFRYYPELLARQTGFSVKQVMDALDELDRECWTIHDEQVLWVRNGLRYDPTGLRSPDYRKAVETWVADLPKSRVVLSFCDYYQIAHPPRQGEDTQSRQVTVAVAVTGAVAVGETLSDSRPTLPVTNGAHAPKRDPALKEHAKAVLGFLNDKRREAGLGQFRLVDTHLRLITARLSNGASVEDCRSIVARKVREWKGDPKTEKWLRPSTLFRESNFENYLGELVKEPTHG